MQNIAMRSFKAAIGVAVFLVLVAVIVAHTLQASPPPPATLKLLSFELDMFKAILAGFVVGMLGILIPAVATEARQRFEQRKESRTAYSEAKTGIDYLKLRLATMTLAEASIALRNVHFQKHIAELFDDFPEWLKKHYGPTMTPGHWNMLMYKKLFGARQKIEQNANSWDGLSPAERIALLDPVLPTQPDLYDVDSVLHGMQ